MFVILIIQYAKHMRRIILSSSVTIRAVQYFSTLSHKLHEYREKNVFEHTMCFWFSLRTLFETFLTVTRICQGIIIRSHSILIKRLSFLSDFSQNWNFSTNFQKTNKYKISCKSDRWDPSCFMKMADRRTDMKKSNTRFFNFVKVPKNQRVF